MAAGFSRAALNSISSAFSTALLITMMAACTGGGEGRGGEGEGRERRGEGEERGQEGAVR